MMRSEITQNVRVILPRAALIAIFDECDRYELDETGGRVIGTYADENGRLTVNITGIIDPGPHARRTATSFFQDGKHQERIFRQLEHNHPELEHLGNWHTHHVNGLATLSSGDVATYQRIVNHANHNTSFFYALLVVAKHRYSEPHQRYLVKHYVLFRGEPRVHEIQSTSIELIDTPLIWPAAKSVRELASAPKPTVPPDRAYDRDIISEFYQGLRPYTAKGLGVYWRGPINLIDDTNVEIVVVESASPSETTYSVALRGPPDTLKATAEELANHEFPTARAAVIATERICNRALHRQLRVSGDERQDTSEA